MTLNMDIIKNDEKMAGAEYAHYCVSAGHARLNDTVNVDEMIDSDAMGLNAGAIMTCAGVRAYWQGYNEFMSNPSI